MQFAEEMRGSWYALINKRVSSGSIEAVETIRYAERWADNLERLMREGKKLEQVAAQAALEAGPPAMTAPAIAKCMAMAMAIGELKDFWAYGHRLANWFEAQKGTTIGPQSP